MRAQGLWVQTNGRPVLGNVRPSRVVDEARAFPLKLFDKGLKGKLEMVAFGFDASDSHTGRRTAATGGVVTRSWAESVSDGV